MLGSRLRSLLFLFLHWWQLSSLNVLVAITFVELQELECASGPPALFFGKAVVGISLVFGRFAHCHGDVAFGIAKRVCRWWWSCTASTGAVTLFSVFFPLLTFGRGAWGGGGPWVVVMLELESLHQRNQALTPIRYPRSNQQPWYWTRRRRTDL